MEKLARSQTDAYVQSNAFKLYYLDTGLLGARLNTHAQLITQKESLYTEYKGALIENYCAKEIKPFLVNNCIIGRAGIKLKLIFLLKILGKYAHLRLKAALQGIKKA